MSGEHLCFPAIGFDPGRAAEAMREHGLGAMLLCSPENVFYTTGYTVLPSSGNPILYTLRNRLPFFSFVDSEGRVTLLCWGFSVEGVEVGADRVIPFNDFAGARRALGTLLSERALRPFVGLESSCPRYVTDLVEERLGRERIGAADGAIEALRLVKAPAELELIRRSTEIIEAAVADLYERIELGMSRLELMRQARLQMFERGATGISHLTFSFGAANPEIAIDEPLRAGALVTLDLGAIYSGYCSDNRRYAYTGELPDGLRERYEAMVAIVDAVGAMLVPGASYAEIFKRALELHEQHGVKPLERLTHVGHNIGLETEERWLDDSERAVVEAGMAINIELYTHADSGEQIGNEETFIVTASGPERISTLPREIRSVR